MRTLLSIQGSLSLVNLFRIDKTILVITTHVYMCVCTLSPSYLHTGVEHIDAPVSRESHMHTLQPFHYAITAKTKGLQS